MIKITLEEILAINDIEKARQLLGEFDNEINKIQMQIENTHRNREENNQYADTLWWRKVNSARRALGFKKQKLQFRISQLKQQHKKEHVKKHNPPEKHKLFYEQAKLYLTGQEIKEIWELVEEELSKREGEKNGD